MEKLFFAKTNNVNPYRNLAVEWSLFSHAKINSTYLYLWQNEPTIVIGANQNPYLECNIQSANLDNTHIARRKTGGGAVYHDLGNLNFSFITDKENYDTAKQFSVIKDCLNNFGIEVEVSGRNDIYIDGKKFSGNAFYKGATHCLHHGTLLIHTDISKVEKYLLPHPEKLSAKGVKSAHSKVVNLSSLDSRITAKGICKPLLDSFQKIYGGKCETIDTDAIEGISENENYFKSAKFIYGDWDNFEGKVTKAFPWGVAQAKVFIDRNTICDIKIATDCLDIELPDKIKKVVLGKTLSQIRELKVEDSKIQDILDMFN